MDPVPDMNRTMRPDVDVRNSKLMVSTSALSPSVGHLSVHLNPNAMMGNDCK